MKGAETMASVFKLNVALNPRDIVTAQQKGERVIGRFVHHFIKKNVRNSKTIVRTAVIKAAEEQGIPTATRSVAWDGLKLFGRVFASSVPEGVPLKMSVLLDYPHPSGTPKKDKCRYLPMTKRPDLDNIAKTLLDCMTDLNVWHDDSQVAELTLQKRCTPDNPCVWIILETLF